MSLKAIVGEMMRRNPALSEEQAKEAFRGVGAAVRAALEAGTEQTRVHMPGLGTFRRVYQRPRIMKNPIGGGGRPVEGRNAIKFRETRPKKPA